MAIQNDNTLVTKGDLKALYSDKIAPYLGANLAIRTNVSDYYSTEEKVVGVWTDGKPLYQKTIIVDLSTITQPTADRTFTNLATITQDYDKCFLVSGFYEYIISGDYRTLPIFGGDTNNTAYYYTTIRKNDNNVWFINLLNEGTTWLRAVLGTNCNAYFVINYTKTTDTASSALTAGCYDINFPNTWPIGSEIYFGNGVYGYRTTGSMNMSKQAHNNVNCGITATKFINQGGYWKANSSYDYPFGCTWSGNGSSSIAWIDRADSNQLKLAFWPDTNLTNATYDVWVTYTK